VVIQQDSTPQKIARPHLPPNVLTWLTIFVAPTGLAVNSSSDESHVTTVKIVLDFFLVSLLFDIEDLCTWLSQMPSWKRESGDFQVADCSA